MSVEQAMLTRARPQVLAAQARAVVQREFCKGCMADIAPYPVSLEPVFAPVLTARGPFEDGHPVLWQAEPPVAEEHLTRLRVWISPEQQWDWRRSELLLRQLHAVGHRIALQLIGNQINVTMMIVCHRDDLPVVRSAFHGEFECCALELLTDDPLARVLPDLWHDVAFIDYFPPPPYSHLLTQPDELHLSPYAPVLSAFADIEPPALGIYQVLLQPVAPGHDWHSNVQALLDLEFAVKLVGNLQLPQRYLQQTPSGDLRQMAVDAESKAHNDRPFFAAALRVAVIGAGEGAERCLRGLGTFSGLVQHGGRPLNRLTSAEYTGRLSAEDLRETFLLGLTYRPGFLLNSWELTSLAHIPPAALTENRPVNLELLETLPATPAMAWGTPIGTCMHAGVQQRVCIPSGLRYQHVHLIGGMGYGKSSLMEAIALHDIEQGHGVAVLDPHGPLVHRLLRMIPAKHIHRVIFIDPGDPHWVPIWNPLGGASKHDLGRVADDLVGAFRSFVTGWGDRLEHLLRHAIYALLHLPGATLFDVSNLLRRKSNESNELRRQVLEVAEDEASSLFWRHDFDRYTNTDLSPPQHKLSKLLGGGTVSLMLSQPDSAFDLRQVMDDGMILLVDLSTIGSEVREILGCFLLSLLHLTALGRDHTDADSLRPFHIHCDEVHRFVTDALEDLIVETRKFKVSLTLAHQYMSQFGTRKIEALSSVGTTIMFHVDSKDAQHLKKDLQGRVEVDDLTTLEVGQAITRIGNEIARIRTLQCFPPTEGDDRDMIIQQSRHRYYRSVDDVRQLVHRRRERWYGPFSPSAGNDKGTRTKGVVPAPRRSANDDTRDEETFVYDEF